MKIFKSAIENGKTMAVASWGAIFGKAIYDCGVAVFNSTDVIECILKTEMQKWGFFLDKKEEDGANHCKDDGGTE